MPFNIKSATHRGSADDKALPSFSIIVSVGATPGLLGTSTDISHVCTLCVPFIPFSLRSCPSISFPLALVVLKEHQALGSPLSFDPVSLGWRSRSPTPPLLSSAVQAVTSGYLCCSRGQQDRHARCFKQFVSQAPKEYRCRLCTV